MPSILIMPAWLGLGGFGKKGFYRLDTWPGFTVGVERERDRERKHCNLTLELCSVMPLVLQCEILFFN